MRARAGASLIGAGAIYLVAEAVTAGAWRRPAYSYASNWISDLGAPIRGVFAGRMIDSPLHTLMNLGFVVSGALFFAGAVLLAAAAPKTKSWVYLGCAALHALGLTLVALVPETTPLPLGNLHRLGALMAIGGGNLAVAFGSSIAGPLVPIRLRGLGLVLGGVGIASLTALIVLGAEFAGVLARLGPGLVERASVYTITIWEALAGALLLMGPNPQAGGANSAALRGTD